MAENDIYDSKGRCKHIIENLDELLIEPNKRKDKPAKQAFYYCKNKTNLEYFRRLALNFDSKDISYIRRCQLFNVLTLICYSIDKDLKYCNRDDVDKIVAFMHTRYKSPKTKSGFIIDIKYIWKILFPEKDEKDRIDENLVPYPVRHLRNKIDKSREKAKRDKLIWEEYESLLNYFSDNPIIQAYLALAVESLGRPQEILYTKIEDLELYDSYAKLHISEHGKEGIGFLQCIESFPYILKWLQNHPFKNDRRAFLFVNKFKNQLKPDAVNKILKEACKKLNIQKPITCYSLKRNGVTFSRLRGESDVEIQHKARWTSTKQLKTYDMSNQEDSFKIALAKRGIIKEDKFRKFLPKTKTCYYCQFDKIGFNEEICPNCLHIIDKNKLKENIKHETELSNFVDSTQMQELFKVVFKLQKEISELKSQKTTQF